jgi:hypothetical protein
MEMNSHAKHLFKKDNINFKLMAEARSFLRNIKVSSMYADFIGILDYLYWE